MLCILFKAALAYTPVNNRSFSHFPHSPPDHLSQEIVSHLLLHHSFSVHAGERKKHPTLRVCGC